MFDTIAGLPIHPLVIHVVVIVLPAVALVSILAVARKRFHSWLPAITVGAAASVGAAYVAGESGQALESRVGDVGIHGEYGDYVKYAAFALFLAVGLFWVLVRRNTTRTLRNLVAVAVIVAAGSSLVTVVLAGHSGAEHVWKDVIANTQPGSGE